jgi:hypothetical protein
MIFPNFFELNDGSKVKVDISRAENGANYEFHIAFINGSTDNFNFPIPYSDVEKERVLTNYPRNEAVAKLETKLQGLVII